jgi:hypothetical protein
MRRRRRDHDQQAIRDIQRAETAVAQQRRMNAAEGAHALRADASQAGVSIHAAALAALAARPAKRPSTRDVPAQRSSP